MVMMTLLVIGIIIYQEIMLSYRLRRFFRKYQNHRLCLPSSLLVVFYCLNLVLNFDLYRGQMKILCLQIL